MTFTAGTCVIHGLIIYINFYIIDFNSLGISNTKV